ncbi:MAG TPA: PIG-L family deacetylase, partial [bacterium]|nr:PIG-L family deacetylase [bacterium]
MNVLAIGAHPDDIEFGCGGSLIKLREQGHRIFMLVMTCGECGG